MYRIHLNVLNAKDQIETEHTSILKQKLVEVKVSIHHKYVKMSYFYN